MKQQRNRMKKVEWRKSAIATLSFKYCWWCSPCFALSCFNILISGGFCVLPLQRQVIIKLGCDAVAGTWACGASVGALGLSAQAPAAASKGLLSQAGPLWQLPVPCMHFRDTGSSGGSTGYLWSDSRALPENLRNFYTCLKVWARPHQLKQLNILNVQCFPMRSKWDISRMCVTSKRRTIDLPLYLHCQYSVSANRLCI